MSSVPEISSPAFAQAVLGSERIRIIGLIGVLGALLLLIVARALVFGTSEEIRLLPLTALLILGMTAFEWAMLTAVDRKLAVGKELPSALWFSSLLIESILPTLALLLLTTMPGVGPYRALVAPAVLTYFFFIILSTLRLNPSLSRLTGFTAAVGYLGVTAFTVQYYPQPVPGAFTLPIYVTNAMLLLAGGFVAGAVATEIRKHILASLREAETRREIERIQEDLKLARSIQQGLFPENPPDAPMFDIAGWNQPAEATGGDYFDWLTLPDGRIALFLADVSGHGIGPALVMAVCRAYARASLPAWKNLRDAVFHLNELLCRDLCAERFVTHVVALLDPVTCRVEMISAGHGPLVLYRAEEDRFQSFDSQGIPFGLMEGVEYGAPEEFEMKQGDILVLLTDGFPEWSNSRDEEFGIARLKESIRSGRDLPASELICQLYQSVKAFAGGIPQQDDLTAVVLKRKQVVSS